MSEPEDAGSVGENVIAGDQAPIPVVIHEYANIEDGDKIRWRWYDGELLVEIVRQRTGVFADFNGFEGKHEAIDIDRTGLEPAGEYDIS